MKCVAARYCLGAGTQHEFNPMCWRFLIIIANADEDWLSNQVLNGVPQRTKPVLGGEDSPTSNLLSLPCWEHSKFLEKGVYIDVVTTNQAPAYPYVGSASGKNGLS